MVKAVTLSLSALHRKLNIKIIVAAGMKLQSNGTLQEEMFDRKIYVIVVISMSINHKNI